MSSSEQSECHVEMLQLALEEAQKCTPSPTAFCVGAVITVKVDSLSKPIILATGYSRELEGNTHAEANALTKIRSYSKEELHQLVPDLPQGATVEDVLAQADIYTTMEPCSVRTSGLAPCANAIVMARLRRCFIGVGEPDDFVNCEGAQRLKDAGVEVIWVKGLEDKCLEVARAGH
ncbi:cytidine deaminase-like protein [Irpex rosettiformis]|uniref:Cytidine deaminase-like protein n=1 Tax=Irpex rosettiformis TaxID=378272 RepID=A0ACB8UHZ2_9APHY|nr:cytidine deaminase-like protein [Irpex rosettiformis]